MKAASTAAGSIAATERKKQQQRAAIQQKQSQKQRQAVEDKESAFLRAIQEKLLTNPTLSTDGAGDAAANLNQEQRLPSMSAEVEVRQTNFFSEQAEELAQPDRDGHGVVEVRDVSTRSSDSHTPTSEGVDRARGEHN